MSCRPSWPPSQGRRGWLREAKRRLDDRRAEEARAVPRSRPARLKEAQRRLEEELWTECQANRAYEEAVRRSYVKVGTPAGVLQWMMTPGLEMTGGRSRSRVVGVGGAAAGA